MDSIQQLGRLHRVEIRSVFLNEAVHFTPWLSREDNLRLLAETVGMELELEEREKSVGPFSADIVCRDVATNKRVLIENQLERTDHTHLGQLITYAAGLKAVTVIWIAHPFTDQHRAALDWLNEITGEGLDFFGLEVELWRIGESSPAPKFNIVSKPNDWTKRAVTSAGSSRELTENRKLQVAYWTAFRAFLENRNSPIRPTKPLPQNWMNLAIGRSGFKLSAVASLYDSVNESWDSHELRAELVIEAKEAESYYLLLEQEREVIEEEFGQALSWYNPETARVCRIFIRRAADLTKQEEWPRQHQWLAEHLERLYRVFHDRILRLNVASPQEL